MQVKSITERTIEAHSTLWEEYRRLERAFCTVGGMFLTPSRAQEEKGLKRLEELTKFFQIESTRKTHNTNFWGSATAFGKVKGVALAGV